MSALPRLTIEGQDGLWLQPFNDNAPDAVFDYVRANPSLQGSAYWARGIADLHRASSLVDAFGEQIRDGSYLAFTVHDQEKAAAIIGTAAMYRSWGETLLEYSTAEDRRRQGIASCAAARVIAFGQEYWGDVSIVGCKVDPENEPSKAVARRIGAVYIKDTSVDMGYGNSKMVEYWEKNL